MFKTVLASSLILAGNIFAQSFWDMKPNEVRNLYNEKTLAIPAEKPDVYSVKDVTIHSDTRMTPLRIYTPSDAKNLPIILFIHGGAWVAGNLETHDNLARYLCKEVKALVVSVAYTTAPEGKFPLPLEQCYDALLWVVKHGGEFHGDPARLAVVGDSAGGNLTAALCLMDRDKKGPKIDLQVLINPITDLTDGASMKPQGDALDNERWYIAQYITKPEDVKNPYASPLMAQDVSHLPPALVILGEKDPFRSQGQKYADRLRAAGVFTNVYVQAGVGHLAGNGARASRLARESLDVAIAALRGELSGQTPLQGTDH